MEDKFRGKVIVGVDGLDIGSDSVTITFEDGCALYMWHSQDCCESVSICDIDSSASLEGAVFLSMEETSKSSSTEYCDEEWTFYTIKTDKGYVWIRWYGESNGYYSTSVSTQYCEAGESRSY